MTVPNFKIVEAEPEASSEPEPEGSANAEPGTLSNDHLNINIFTKSSLHFFLTTEPPSPEKEPDSEPEASASNPEPESKSGKKFSFF